MDMKNSVVSFLRYDEDKMIPTYGFGLKPAPGAPAEHCWPLTYDHARPEVHGVQVRYRLETEPIVLEVTDID